MLWLIVSTAFAVSGFAASDTLSGSGGNTLPGLPWAIPANWSLGVLPGSSDNAVIAASGFVDVRGSTLGGAAEVQDLAFTGASAVTLQNNSSSTAIVLSLNGGRGAGVPLISCTGNVARTIAGPGTNATPHSLSLQLKASGDVSVAANTLTISAAILESGGARSINKTGAGTLVLSGLNSYSGGTTVDGGILSLTANAGSCAIRGSLTVNAGGTVVTTGDGTGLGFTDARVSSLTINGGVVTSAGLLHIWNIAGGVTLTGGTLSSNGGVSTTTGPQLEWGNTTLSSNASADPSTVAGRIRIRPEASSLLRVNVADGPAGTDLLITAALTESASGGGLTKSGAGLLKLDGAVNLTGFITVNAGTLDLSSATLGAGFRINVLSGARFIPPTSGLPPLAMIYVDGEKLRPGTWGAPGSVAAGLAQFESPALAGSSVVTLTDTGLSNRERWKTLKYGIFSHYTYASTGTGDVNEAANAFNATQFANDVAEAGAQYVVWTAWHSNTIPLFPNQTLPNYGWPGRYSQRDTVSDMIDAVRAKGIRVILYTHPYQPITSPLSTHNNFINDLYSEVMDRYGSRIDGLWIDENQINADQDSLVDYKRLMATIKERNPDMVTMQNGWQLYTVDTGGNETVGSWNFGQSQAMYNLVTGQGVSSDDMLRTTVLQAAANFDGGGIHWSIDGVANGGLSETTRAFALGRYLAPIRPAVCETTPSASFPPPYKNGGSITYDTVDWVATTATDETKEFIHVLKAPAGNTLTLPGTADGKVFSTATLMASLQTGGGTQSYLGLAMAMIQTPRGIQLTLPGGVSWSSIDTVIQLNVAAKGGAGMVNDTSAAISYTGSSWTLQSPRGTGEYNDDAHIATANGDSFTCTFSGTDIEYIATRAANRGAVAIYIDDVFQTTVDPSVGTPLGSRQSLFKRSGLTRGTHTLRAVKAGGTFMEVDALRVTEMINDSDPDLEASFQSTLYLGSQSAAYNGQWQPGYGWITPGAGYYPDGSPFSGAVPAGDRFDFAFYGTEATVTVGSQYASGYFYFMVDGVFRSNVGVSTGSALQTFSTGTLPLGNHTIRGIVWKTSTDPFQPGVHGFSVTRPDLWNAQSGRGYGEIGDDVHYTDINPGAFSFGFSGSGVDVITTRDSDARMAYFWVSGMGRSFGARYNNYWPTRQTGSSVFTRANLAPGNYSVSVQHAANTSGMNFSFARLAIDALRIYKGESLSAAPLFWGATGSGGSGAWDIGTAANWHDGARAMPWYDFGGTDYASVFSGAAGTVSLASNVTANRVTFRTAGYLLQGNSLTLNGTAPVITADSSATISSTLNGSSDWTKAGAGTLTITGTNACTGAASIEAGTLALSGAYASPSFAIASGAALSLNAATILSLPSVTFQGTGTLRKTGASEIRWGVDTAVFAMGSGSLIDVQSGVFVGGSNGNENWTNNLSDLNVASGASFAGVEANVRVDALTGSGVISSGYSGAGYSAFTFGVDNGSGTFSGSLVNGASLGNFIKTGTGTQTLTGSSSYTGSTTVSAGTLLVNGSASTSTITVASGATLGGTGTVGNVSVAVGGKLSPGTVGVGTLTGGNINNAGTLAIDIASAGNADRLNATGSVTLSGPLEVVASPGIATGTSFTIVNKTSGGAVGGTFAGKPQGSQFVASGYKWVISYTGGNGNDVTLTTQTLTPIEQWRLQYFGTTTNSGSAADAFDANGDAELNLLEFATGQNPNAATSAAIAVTRNGATLEFVYFRSNAAVSDGVAFTVEWSDTLAAGSWSSAGVAEQVINDNGTIRQVKATVSAGTGKRFLRLKVSKP